MPAYPTGSHSSLTVAISFVGGVVIERVVIRPVEHAPVLSIVTVFIALLVIFNSVAGWIFTYTIKTFPSPFPEQPLFGNRFVSSHELGAIGITLVVLLLLYAFFRFTPLGLAMRAAAQNPTPAAWWGYGSAGCLPWAGDLRRPSVLWPVCWWRPSSISSPI